MVDALITLHESNDDIENTYNLGIGSLFEALSCEVTEERNGEFELVMEYPITGKWFKELRLRRIIMAEPNPYSDRQAFRIYAITKPINGIVTLNAEHISYDLSGYPVQPFKADGIQNALSSLVSNCAVPCPFRFSTSRLTSAQMTVSKPASIRSLLGGMSGSLLDIYGGEYEFDNYDVKLENERGADRGVSIRYGKNLTDLKQEENCSSVYTGVYPFWYSEQDGLFQLSEKIVSAPGTYDFTRIYPLDLSQEWVEKPTEEQIRSKTESYIKANNIGVPKVSLTVSFIQLAQCEEYHNYALLERVHLCDTVSIEFAELGVSAKAKCIKTVYDAITRKYKSIELGEARSNLSSTISSQNQAIQENISKTFMQQAIENATKLISGGLGGYVIIHSSTGGNHPDEILIMDTDDINTASKVWRWNKGGLGYSSTGYNGPYALAMTQDGQIVADFITTGTMSASLINGGVLNIGGLDDADGIIYVKDGDGKILVTLDKNGISLTNGCTISWNNVSDQPDIPSDDHITKITKDTVSSEYIEGLHLEVGDEISMGANATISWNNVSDQPDIPSDDHITKITKDTVTAEYISALKASAGALAIADDSGGWNIIANSAGWWVVGKNPATGEKNDVATPAYFMDVNGRIYMHIGGFLRYKNEGEFLTGAWASSSGEYRSHRTRWYNIAVACDDTSDIRCKNTLRGLDDEKYMEELFDSLKPTAFYYNADSGYVGTQRHLGFIAQDVEKSINDIGIKEDMALFDHMDKDKLGVDKQEIIALCVWQIQKLKKRVDELEKFIRNGGSN
jgi:phage minor structural protein